MKSANTPPSAKTSGRYPDCFIRWSSEDVEHDSYGSIVERRFLEERLLIELGTARLLVKAISRPISATPGLLGGPDAVVGQAKGEKWDHCHEEQKKIEPELLISVCHAMRPSQCSLYFLAIII